MATSIKKKIAVIPADPAGNPTVFVLSGATPDEYKSIARALLEHPDIECEQVAFVTGSRSIEMSGMEFCGNAARAFAYIAAKGMIDGKTEPGPVAVLDISSSGTSSLIPCVADLDKGLAASVMPLPKRFKTLKDCDFEPAIGKTVVIMDGITHLIADGIQYTEENYLKMKEALIREFDPDALGVLYLDKDKLELTPLVHVRKVDSTYMEGSCASGAAACAAYLSDGRPDGELEFTFHQPKGELSAVVNVRDGKASRISIGGSVSFSEPRYVEIEYESNNEESLDQIY